MRNKRSLTAVQRWGARALTLLLACALMAGLAVTASARGDWQGEVVDPAIPKPIVTIQGNLVTEKGKPTGFYELALCVQSGRTIEGPDPADWTTQKILTEAEYAQVLAEIENGTAPAGVTEDSYTLTYYPFRTASAAMNINTDILTAVNWNLASVTYETYNDGYLSDDTNPGKYPRGINTDPAVQGYAESGLLESEAFPDITTPNLYLGQRSVALDVEGDPRMFTAEGVVEHFENNTALITLSAAAPDNRPVVLPQSTPLVVARFSYDLKRFSTTKVNENLGALYAQRNSIAGDIGADGFWMGWDKTTGHANNFSSKQALTWLGESGSTLYDFSDSDELISYTQGDQAVWVHTGTNAGSATDQETYFYYYLGAEQDQKDGSDTVLVNIGGVPTEVEDVAIPKTAGQKVLTEGTDLNDGATPAEYTYFKNLLRLRDDTLVLKLVNEPTFKRPANANDNIILFYDWDDTLIGTLAVGKGDVRAEVEAYIEETLVHPDLRPGSAFMDDGYGNVDLNKLASLQRDYTYRGKYAYTVGGDDATLGVADGKEYPLTNKLDYVFTKRVNTSITQEENGATVQYVHPYAMNDPALDPGNDIDATEFPYVYGWAVVEDTRAFNGKKDAVGTKGEWKVMHDATKLEDTWTTMGVGELSNMTSAVMSNPTLSTVAANPTAERFVPVFLKDADETWIDGTRPDANDYLYTLSGANSYLRFADFSDITAELERYEGKNTLIVKAVYEVGPELAQGGQYQMMVEPYYNKFSNPAASAGGAYSVEVTLERATTQRGPLQGVDRARMPAVRQDTTIDQKWIQDNALGVDHNLNNTDVKTARALTETTYTKVDVDNGEEVTFTLSLSARQNKVDYYLIETYGNNFISGTTKSLTNYERIGSAHTIDNYNYYTADSDDNDAYFDVTKYDERDGSHGYVLYGTLNFLMKQATRVEWGEIERSDFVRGSGYEALMDANLRTDASGTQPDAASAILVMQPKILDAAAACVANPTPDVWNAERGYAELSYHQLQYYILGDPVWSDRAAADAKPLAWCHLHASCAAAVSGKPKDWNELVAYARDPAKADGIGELLPGEIETLFGLRRNTNGAQYTAGAEFKANVVAAVNAGCESWAEVQYYILYKTAPADAAAALAEAKTSFWWYDGSTSAPGTPGNLRALITATDDYFRVVTLPDGTQEDGWTAKLDRGKRNFDSNNDGDNTTVATGWKNMTQNLVAKWIIEEVGGKPTGAESTEKFADWESFRSELLRVVEIARTAGATPANDSEYWYKAQYLIIHPDETTWPTFGVGDGTSEGDEMDGYWWRNGGTHLFINSLPSMLNVAALVNDGDETAKAVWDRFRLADFLKCEDMTDLALNFTGTDKIDNLEVDGLTPNSNEINDFKGKILALKEFGANNTWFNLDVSTNANLWKDVQYWLLHEPSEVKPNLISGEYQYYWWEDNGTPTAVSLIGMPGEVQSWLNAAFAEVSNGNAVAWDKLTANNADGVSNNAFNNTRLRNPAAEDVTPGNTTYQNVNDIPVLSAADIKLEMNAIVAEIINGKTGHQTHTPPSTITWYQVQDYLITGTYTETPTAEQITDWEKQYWWLDLDENPDKAQVVVDTAAIDTFIEKFIYPDNKISTIELDDLERNDGGELTFRRTDATTGFSGRGMLAKAKTRLGDLLSANSVAQTPPQSLDTLTWYQIQYALMDSDAGGGEGAYLTPNQAYHRLKDVATWAPDWVKQLPEPPAPEPLNYFVKTFLSSGNPNAIVVADLDGSALGELNFKKSDAMTGFSGRGAINTAKTRLDSLLKNLPKGVSADSLTWYQIQYALMDEGNGAYKSPLEAYQWAQALPVTWAPPCATTAPVPEGASLLALDIELFEPEEPATPTLDDLLAQKAELERQLAALEEQIAAAQEAAKPDGEKTETPAEELQAAGERPAAVSRPTTGTSVSTPTEPEKPVTPVTPEPPAEDDTPVEVDTPAQPETPAKENTDERVEIPLGEEAMSATRRPIATAGQNESGTAERSAADIPVGLVDKVYRLEPDEWRRRLSYAT